jgi:hypothetical protein
MPGQSQGSKDEKPEVWPAAGTPLRVPKCVFLTSCPPAHLWGKNFTLMSKWAPFGYFGHYFDAVARDIRVTPTATMVPNGSELFDGFSGNYSYIGWTIDPQYPLTNDGRRKWNKCSVVLNLIYNEHLRLVNEFQIAKAYLETRYPNQVFVQICEFFPNSPVTAIAPNDELMPKVLDVYSDAGIAANAPKHKANGPVWLLGPDTIDFDPTSRQFTTDFFGTNFLHIYCGYQATGGGDGSVVDLLGRFHWSDIKFGYKLDTTFGPGFDQWIVLPNFEGYEGDSYGIALNRLKGDMGSGDPTLVPSGKFDNLLLGYRNFAGYHTSLHEYDLDFNFGAPAQFLSGMGIGTIWPRGDVVYGDQDWVEQVIILGYDEREAIYGSGAPYFDEDFPGVDFDGGVYNHFIRYPGTDEYVNTWIPELQTQWSTLKTAMLDLGPKTVSLWDDLFTRYNLADFGFSYDGGSSVVDADYIIKYVQTYYGLK